jgi:diaminopimelate epimerase
MGAEIRLVDIPLAEEFVTPLHRVAGRPDRRPVLHSPSVVSMGNPHADLLADDVNAYATPAAWPLENHPVSRARQYHWRISSSRSQTTIRTWEGVD